MSLSCKSNHGAQLLSLNWPKLHNPKIHPNNRQNQLNAFIEEFCASINPKCSPIEIPVRVEPYSVAGSCFKNVEQKVLREGGEILTGWDITWESDGPLEAECHAVWVAQNGDLLDITPRKLRNRHALFLPQPGCWDGNTFVPNKRIAFKDTPSSRALFMLAAMQDELKKASWTNKSWTITVAQNDDLLKRASQIFFGVPKSDLCPCGSRAVFGKCCGHPIGKPWRNF
jgi:hypothetical protein